MFRSGVCAGHSSSSTSNLVHCVSSWSLLCAEEHGHAGTGLGFIFPVKKKIVMLQHIKIFYTVALWQLFTAESDDQESTNYIM